MPRKQNQIENEGSIAILDRPPQGRPETEFHLIPPFHVILLNDNDHSYFYVIEMLQKLFGYDKEKCFKMAQEVDKEGNVIVWTGPKKTAKFKQEQIHAYGKDKTIKECKGSMYAILEPSV